MTVWRYRGQCYTARELLELRERHERDSREQRNRALRFERAGHPDLASCYYERSDTAWRRYNELARVTADPADDTGLLAKLDKLTLQLLSLADESRDLVEQLDTIGIPAVVRKPLYSVTEDLIAATAHSQRASTAFTKNFQDIREIAARACADRP